MVSGKEQTGKYNITKASIIAGLILSIVQTLSCSSFAAAGLLKAKPKPNSQTAVNVPNKTKQAQASDNGELTPESTRINQTNTPYADEAIKHYNHGVELHQAGFLNQAIGEYKAAILADGRIEEAYSNIGIIYASQHNYPHAREAFEQALKLKPNRPTTLNGLGTVIYAQGQTAQAMEKWKEALAADPKFASALYNMGNAYEGQKNYAEAKSCYLKALTVAPNMSDSYFRLGNILIREYHWAQAEILLRKAIELAPDSEFSREAKHSLSIIESRFEKTKAKPPAPHKKQ